MYGLFGRRLWGKDFKERFSILYGSDGFFYDNEDEYKLPTLEFSIESSDKSLTAFVGKEYPVTLKIYNIKDQSLPAKNIFYQLQNIDINIEHILSISMDINIDNTDNINICYQHWQC